MLITFLMFGFTDFDHFNVHLRIKARNGKKCFTFVENLDKATPEILTVIEFMQSKTRDFKKKFNCSATLIIVDDDPKHIEYIIKLQGDHREALKNYLTSTNIVSSDQVMIHGW